MDQKDDISLTSCSCDVLRYEESRRPWCRGRGFERLAECGKRTSSISDTSMSSAAMGDGTVSPGRRVGSKTGERESWEETERLL